MRTPIVSIRALLATLLLGLTAGRLAGQRFHRLPATPRTVAYGYASPSWWMATWGCTSWFRNRSWGN